jgi:hypothetical protein
MLAGLHQARLCIHRPESHCGNKDAGSIGVGGHWTLYHSATDAGDRDLLESDYIYFDPYRDAELARVMNYVTMPQMFFPPPPS